MENKLQELDISIEDHHSGDWWTSTKMKDFLKRGNKYYEGVYIDKTIKKNQPTVHMQVGTHLHTLIEKFFCNQDMVDKWLELDRVVPHDTFGIFSQGGDNKFAPSLAKMAQSVVSRIDSIFPVDGEFCSHVKCEKTFVWNVPNSAERVAIRPDLLIRAENTVFNVDLKTVSKLTFQDIKRSIDNYDYHLQANAYSYALECGLGLKTSDFEHPIDKQTSVEEGPSKSLQIANEWGHLCPTLWLFVEKDEPYESTFVYKHSYGSVAVFKDLLEKIIATCPIHLRSKIMALGMCTSREQSELDYRVKKFILEGRFYDDYNQVTLEKTPGDLTKPATGVV